MQWIAENTGKRRRGVQYMDDWDSRQKVRTERRLIFDEMEQSAQSARGTTNDVGKPDGDIRDLVADE